MPSISDRLNEAMKMKKMKQVDLVKMTGISKSAISTYLSGAYEPKTKNLKKLAKALKVSEAWLNGEESEDVMTNDIKVKIYDLLYDETAAYVSNFDESAISSEILRVSNASVDSYFGLVIKDESMSPQIVEGDIIIVQKQDFACDDDLVVIKISDKKTICRKVKYIEKGITFIPFNYNYETLFFTNEDIEKLHIEILGKVIETRHKF